MEGDPERRRWTLLLLRGDGVRAGSWSFGPRAGAAAGAAAALSLVALGAAAGVWWADGRAEDRTERLRAEVRELRAERSRVRLLAARLDTIERDYRRLRQALIGGSADSSRAVRLPEVAGGAEATGHGAEEERWRWPLARRGFVTRSFDAQGPTGHPGMDVAVPTGSYVRASRAGVVEEAGIDSVYGRFVRVGHGGGYSSLYGHAEWVFVSAGDTVEGGQVIALTGSTGRSSAPHLHFEVLQESRSVDPARLLHESARGRGPLQRDRGGTP